MTARTPPHQVPIDQFVSDLHQVCGLFDVVTAENRNMTRGGMKLQSCAGLDMVLVATDVQRISRNAQQIRQDHGQNFFLILQQEGRALMRQNEATFMLRPGDFMLIDSSLPSEFVYFGEFNRQISLHLPRTEMKARFGDDLIRGGGALPKQSASSMGISAVVGKVISRQGINTAADGYLREALYGLLGAMLHEQSARDTYKGCETDLSGARALIAGQAYIDAHFTRPDFSISEMADDLGLSLRQIQRGFALVGSTATKYLLHKRLEHARRALELREAGRPAVLVSSIAYEAGFSDLSYFHRRFRKTFGSSPNSLKI